MLLILLVFCVVLCCVFGLALFFVICLVCLKVPVSLDCLFMIAPSVSLPVSLDCLFMIVPSVSLPVSLDCLFMIAPSVSLPFIKLRMYLVCLFLRCVDWILELFQQWYFLVLSFSFIEVLLSYLLGKRLFNYISVKPLRYD